MKQKNTSGFSNANNTNNQSETIRDQTMTIFNKKEFCPMKIKTIEDDSSSETVFDLKMAEAISLEQIIMAQ